MVRLDVSRLRYLTRDDFRVLTAVEMGMKNHEVVPTQLILRIANLKKTNGHLIIGVLAKYNLIKHENKTYDGYKLTYQGYDYLALKAFINKGLIKGVGGRIGVGKESDVYEVLGTNDEVMILKIHRLGRVCFRAVKQKRDYLQHRQSASFMYMSRLAAVREFAYLKALYDEGFPTPVPYEINRHCILMSKANGRPLNGVTRLKYPEKVYNTLMNLLVKLAQCGLIHGDFNEFNLLISPTEDITVIDFPQMVSVSHPNAKEYFDRDSHGIRRFFNRKLGYEFHDVPEFIVDTEQTKELDQILKASGSQKMNLFRNDRDQEDYDRIMGEAREMLYQDGDDEDDDTEDDVIEDDSNAEMVLYEDTNDIIDDIGDQCDEDDENENDISHPDDKQFMRTRHAKNADKYNPISSYLKPHEADDASGLTDDDSDDLYGGMMLTEKHLEGLHIVDDENDDDEKKLYAVYGIVDDDSDPSEGQPLYHMEDLSSNDSDDDACDGNAEFLPKEEYLQRKRDAKLLALSKSRKAITAPTLGQVRNKVREDREKEKAKHKRKVRRATKGMDVRTKKAEKEIKMALRDYKR